LDAGPLFDGVVMTISPEIRRQIDACRSMQIDSASSELAALRQAAVENPEVDAALRQSLAFDAKLLDALLDVPVPAGLSQRISAELAKHEEKAIAPAKQNRRQLLAWAVLATAAALAGIWFSLTPPSTKQEHVTQAELSERSEVWFKEAFAIAGWRDDVESIPTAFAKDSNVRGKIVRWREITEGPESQMVALDLTPAGESARAILLVAVTDAQYEVTTLPITALPTSGKLRSVAWQKDKTLFVLAVQEEDGQRLEQFLRSQQLTFNE